MNLITTFHKHTEVIMNKYKIGQPVMWGDTLCEIEDITKNCTWVRVSYNSTLRGIKVKAFKNIPIDWIKEVK